MTKKGEIDYFKNIGVNGLNFTLQKPFSAHPNADILLSNMAAIFTIITNNYQNKMVKVLDIGCGSGWTSYFLAKTGLEVVGIDISKDAIKAAKSHFASELKNLTFQVADFEKISSDLSDFDVVIFIDSLHHADSQLSVLRSAHKALKNGGICIICEPGKGHSKAVDALNAKKLYGVNEYDVIPKNIVRLSKAIGFTSSEIFAHPSLTHKVIYKRFIGGSLKARLLNNRLTKTAATLYVLVVKKYSEGLIVLYK